MLKLSIILALILVLIPSVACSENDPLPDRLFARGITLVDDEPLLLAQDGLVWMELRPDLDYESVRALGAPTQVSRGIVKGFSLPVYSPGEELSLDMHAPDRWDNDSDIHVHVHCYLDTANDGRNFNLQFSWVYYTAGEVVPATVSANLTVETATGNATQFLSYRVDFLLDYDIDPVDPLVSSDELHFNLRRLDASTNEIAGNVVITHVGVVFRKDKLGAEEP